MHIKHMELTKFVFSILIVSTTYFKMVFSKVEVNTFSETIG